jgi:hypothetical protein
VQVEVLEIEVAADQFRDLPHTAAKPLGAVERDRNLRQPGFDVRAREAGRKRRDEIVRDRRRRDVQPLPERPAPVRARGVVDRGAGIGELRRQPFVNRVARLQRAVEQQPRVIGADRNPQVGDVGRRRALERQRRRVRRVVESVVDRHRSMPDARSRFGAAEQHADRRPA